MFEIEPILEKISIVEELAQCGELYKIDYDVNDDECNFCEYKYLCLPEKKPLEEVDKKVLEDAVEKYRLGKQLEARAEEIINSSKEILEAYAKEQPEQKLYINELSIPLQRAEVHRYTARLIRLAKLRTLKRGELK